MSVAKGGTIKKLCSVVLVVTDSVSYELLWRLMTLSFVYCFIASVELKFSLHRERPVVSSGFVFVRELF